MALCHFLAKNDCGHHRLLKGTIHLLGGEEMGKWGNSRMNEVFNPEFMQGFIIHGILLRLAFGTRGPPYYRLLY